MGLNETKTISSYCPFYSYTISPKHSQSQTCTPSIPLPKWLMEHSHEVLTLFYGGTLCKRLNRTRIYFTPTHFEIFFLNITYCIQGMKYLTNRKPYFLMAECIKRTSSGNYHSFCLSSETLRLTFLVGLDCRTAFLGLRSRRCAPRSSPRS